MAFWKRLGGFLSSSGSTYRQEGSQSGNSAGGAKTAVPVTLDSALQLSAAWACARLISESIGSLPLNVYKKNADGSREIAKDHPLQRLFHGKVNKWQTRQEFFETLTYQLVFLGNNYSVIQRNSAGDIISLVPLMSAQMEVSLIDGDIVYRYTEGSNVNAYSKETIWHNKLFGNGVIGLSPLDYARNSLGIAQAVESVVTGIYNNGGKPSGVLTMDKVLTPEQRKIIKENFGGVTTDNMDRLFTLEAGMKFQQVSLSPQDIELLSSRRFQIEDIARFFGVPSVLINDTNAGTTWGSGVQQIVQGFYKLNLRPYLERYEASMTSWLLTPAERLEYEIEFDFNALLRPDKAERAKTNKESIMSGQMTPNEARLSEGDLPKEGGDQLFMQSQMTPINMLPVGSTLKPEENNDKLPIGE